MKKVKKYIFLCMDLLMSQKAESLKHYALIKAAITLEGSK